MLLTGESIWHLSPLILMLGVLALNHLIVHHRTERRYKLEAARLTGALIAELRALHKLYLINLDLIERNATYVLSSRSSSVIYRGNIGRLTSLFDVPIIERLVTLFAENEALEARLAAQATSKGGMSYQLTVDTKLEELKQMYAIGAKDLESTCDNLLRSTSAMGQPMQELSVLTRFDLALAHLYETFFGQSTRRTSR